MIEARPGGAAGNEPQASKRKTQKQDNTHAVPRSNVPQSFRLLGDITAGIVDDLGHRRARLLVEERPDG